MRVSMVMKQMSISTLRRIGLSDWLPSWHRHDLPLVTHLEGIFDRLKVDAVLDVGANSGQYYKMLRTLVGFDGRIFSYEPNPVLATTLQALAHGDPKWHWNSIAIGRDVGRLLLRICRDDVLASFRQPNSTSMDLFGKNAEVVDEIEVDVLPLSEVLSTVKMEYGIRSPYLKLDTQGFDLEILEGAADVLETIPALQTELSFRSIYDDAPAWGRVVAFLEDHGFRLSGLFAIGSDSKGALIEADGVFVNTAWKR